MKKLLTIISFIIFNISIIADNFSIKLMGFATSQNLYRGAQIYPHASFGAGPMFVFYNKFSLAGPNLFYTPFKKDSPIFLKTGLRYFDDNKPMFATKNHELDYRNRRKNSLELFQAISFQFGPRKKFALGGEISRDMISYKGLFFEPFVQIPVLPFTTFKTKFGFGQSSTNKYVYGSDGISGSSFVDFNINIVFPFVPWKGIAMIGGNYSVITRGINRHSEYIRGNYKQKLTYLRVVWDAY